MKYIVTLTAQAAVSTSVEVEAASEEAARKAAIEEARSGNVQWNYDGADDESIEDQEVKAHA